MKLIFLVLVVYNIAAMEKAQKKVTVSPYLIVLLSLVGIILLGSFLLTLPFAHQDGQWGKYLDSLFVSTSATCVTGLMTINNYGDLTVFGQVVVLIMLQIGGLGLMTFISIFLMALKNKLNYSNRSLLKDMLNITIWKL